MDYEKKDLIRESKQLYGEINSCIADLVNARIAKNLYNEGRAIFKMEGLMVGTMQHLGCVIDFLDEQKECLADDSKTSESEDERIRKALVIMIKVPRKEIFEAQGITKEQALAYLEKHKEPIDPFDTKLFQDGVKEGRRLEREEIEKEQKPASSGSSEKPNNLLWSEDKFPKDIEKDATQFCFDKGFNITPYQAKEIATHYLMIGHNFGYVEGRKNAHIPAKELGLPSSMDFKQEWSEEDEHCIELLDTIIDSSALIPKNRIKCHSFLKSLRPQPKKELSIEKAIQWLDDTFYFLDNSSGRGRDCEITTNDFDSLEEMYDSFRKAVTVDSQPSWKPSEEQIEALQNAVALTGWDEELTGLFDQLKKL